MPAETPFQSALILPLVTALPPLGLIAAQAQFGAGASYALTDETVTSGSWHYFLEDVELNGRVTLHGPVSVETNASTDVDLVAVQSDALNPDVKALVLLVGALGALGLAIRRRQRHD